MVNVTDNIQWINKPNTIDIWLHEILGYQDKILGKLDELAIANFWKIYPEENLPNIIVTIHNDKIHRTNSLDSLQSSGIQLFEHGEKYVDIHPTYQERFDQYLSDLTEIEQDRHILRAFFRKILNEANTYLELYLMLPKALHASTSYFFPDKNIQRNLPSLSGYTAAQLKAGEFHKGTKNAIDIIKKHLFIKMMLAK